MANNDTPRIYLITPPDPEAGAFAPLLTEILDRHDIACLRLAVAGRDEDRIGRAADAVREICHARDVPLVLDDHWQLAQRLGLDGVHLNDGARSVRAARKALGRDAIVGAFCAASRHAGMSAAEAGADYVSFGPVAPSALGDGSVADADLFEWWSEMIEVPVVAEGGLTAELAGALSDKTDFLAIGDEIWSRDDPAGALAALIAGTGGA